MKKALTLFAGLLVFGTCGWADIVATYTFTGTNSISGNAVGAQADFDLNGNQLTVTLTNTAPNNANKFLPTDLLMALFFGSSPLSLTTGTAKAPSIVNKPGTATCSSGTCDVSSGFEFLNFGSSHHSAFNGISAVGLGVFGQSNFKSGASTNLGGADYGIVPASYPGTGGPNNGGIPNILELNSVVFELFFASGAPTDLTGLQNLLGTVTFQYGTALTEPSYTGGHTPQVDPVPEPSSILLFGSVAALIGRRFLRRSAQ